MPFWYFVPVPKLPPEVSHQSNNVDLIKYVAAERGKVNIGTPIALVENFWAVIEITATSPGLLKKTFFDSHTVIPIGDPIAIIEADGENLPYGKDRSKARIVKMKRDKPLKK